MGWKLFVILKLFISCFKFFIVLLFLSILCSDFWYGVLQSGEYSFIRIIWQGYGKRWRLSSLFWSLDSMFLLCRTVEFFVEWKLALQDGIFCVLTSLIISVSCLCSLTLCTFLFWFPYLWKENNFYLHLNINMDIFRTPRRCWIHSEMLIKY